MEIGPGRGDLLLTLAAQNPHLKYVAIEIGKKRYFKLIERIKKRKLENIILLCGDARVALKRYFDPATFKKIFVLFPDPWPKKRHAFRRLLSREWIDVMLHLLKPDSELITATDVPWYAEWVFENLTSFTQLTNTLSPARFLPELADLPETYFQKKWRDMGLNLHFMKHVKR